MSRVRIEIFDGDFEDAPAYTRESTAEAEGDGLHEAFERAVAMARAALPPDRRKLAAAQCPPPCCAQAARPGRRCHLPAGHSGGHEFVPARCRSNCPVAGHLNEMGRCHYPRGHEGDHESDSGCRWSHKGMGGHTPDGY